VIAKPKILLEDLLGIDYPIIMAPMFLISNSKMVIGALNSGITGAIPALNYRTDQELRNAIQEIKSASNKPFGINLIVNKSNFKLKQQLDTCLEMGVNYIITSLGSPKDVINQCKEKGIKVFCDVVDLKYAKKVEELGADAVIAVNSGAGGHAGNLDKKDLIPLLRENLKIPIISAGGVAKGEHIKEALDLGASGVSVGTIFIASKEAPVSKEYKDAIVRYKGKDIVKTTKISGSALTVINTPYVKKMGTKPGFLEKLLNKNKKLKKYVKLLLAVKGMKAVEKAAFKATYKTLWCAGPSIEYVNEVKSVRKIITALVEDYKVATS